MLQPGKPPVLLFILLLTVILLGCQPDRSPESDLIQTAVPTNTIRPTTTPAPTQTKPPSPPTNTIEPATPTPLPTSTPEPTATATPIDWTAIQNGATILYYHDQDLWRTDIDGQQQQPLTEGDFLQSWGFENIEDKWWSGGIMPQPFVSPDGRYIAFTQTGGNVVIIDLANPASPRTLSSGSTIMVWSPNSRYLAYGRGKLNLYDAQTNRARDLTGSLPRGVHSITWSPDSLYIGFSCCFEEPEGEYLGLEYGGVKQYDLETGLITTVGPATTSIAGGPSTLCWQASGQFATYEDTLQHDYCTGSSLPLYIGQSPDGRLGVSLVYSDSADPLHLRQLTVQSSETLEILWQIVLEEQANSVTWSTDGRYLLLNNNYPSLSPIWRLLADGASSPEIIVEESYLLGIVPIWQTSP